MAVRPAVRLRRAARRPGRRRDLPALAVYALRLSVSHRTAAPGPRPGQPRGACLRPPARLAGLPPPGPGGTPRRRRPRLPPPARPLAPRPEGDRRLAGRPYRLSGRRRGHAPAPPRGLDAGPGATARGELPRQDAVRGLAGGCPPFPGPAGRRRPREEPAQLAVGRRNRHGHPPEPAPQPPRPGTPFRPRRGVRTPLAPGTAAPRRQDGPPSPAPRRSRPRGPGLPRPDRGPGGGRRPVQGGASTDGTGTGTGAGTAAPRRFSRRGRPAEPPCPRPPD